MECSTTQRVLPSPLPCAAPEPPPISCCSKFQAMPERSTNTMPVRTTRSGVGWRPAYQFARCPRGQQWFDELPQFVAHQFFGHRFLSDRTRQKVNTDGGSQRPYVLVSQHFPKRGVLCAQATNLNALPCASAGSSWRPVLRAPTPSARNLKNAAVLASACACSSSARAAAADCSTSAAFCCSP